MRHRRHRRMHGLGKLSPGCEIHVFRDKNGNPMTGEGSRKKVCFKKKPSDKAVKAWTANLMAACASSKSGVPSEACKAIGGKKSAAKKPAAKKAAKKKKSK